jgi:hypothetical protein
MRVGAVAYSCSILLLALGGTVAQADGTRPVELPPQELIDAAFAEGPQPPVHVEVATKPTEQIAAACGLQPADLVVSRGDHARHYEILIKSGDEPVHEPSEVFIRIGRLTVDADGSARAYHPADPLGIGVCEPGKENVCAIDRIDNADVALFEGTEPIRSKATVAESARYIETWSKAWSRIAKDPTRSISHSMDARIPEQFALYYLKNDNLAVVFKTTIIPFRNGAPCMRGPSLRDPGYFVAATTFTTSRVTPRTVCNPAHYLDASRIPFVVLPGDVFGNVRPGDIAIGFAQSGAGPRLVYGIVGDIGPPFSVAEASIAFNSRMLGRTAPLTNSTDQEHIDIELPKDGLTALGILILAGTRVALRGDFSADNIADVGRRMLKRWAAKQRPEERLLACLQAAPINKHQED